MASEEWIGSRRRGLPAGVSIRPVLDGQWEIVAWLWQLFRHDLSMIVNGLPYATGRYQAGELNGLPSPNMAGYLAWRAHPKTGEDAPLGFGLVGGLESKTRSVVGFWVAPVVRREGIGHHLAIEILTRHEGAWSIGFQQENTRAAAFWREIADVAFGPGYWSEQQRPVPGHPDGPPEHFIESS